MADRDVEKSLKRTVRPGINTIEITAARELHARTVNARNPRNERAMQTTTTTTTMAKSSASFFKEPIPRHVCNSANNPPCKHCGRMIIPSPVATYPLEDNPSISINNWTITSRKRPILNSEELEDWETNKLSGLGALPEMIFGNNYISIKNVEKNWSIDFRALDALSMVNLEDSGIRVSYSKDWINSKLKTTAKEVHEDDLFEISSESLNIVKNYDWTYSTEYKGTVINYNDNDVIDFKTDNDLVLPIDKLSKPDQILFFDDMILFEDELADNGISILNVKIRVMNERLLLLSRFFLRVDDVIVRVYDTRIYVEFDENKVIREFKQYESEYNDLMANQKRVLAHSRDPKALLRDSNWVVEHIPLVKRQCEVIQF
ncbi:hypothetical protein KAFR_0B00780 [Kazachstania africana CBS 2517]|uniref:Tip41p n=1 Tax=Kazachstania africana (strain ATCC 22294 / BCRC 22015 / CBS 2517 / CECT 1963 / NBRC 1671 / NRRL Y-8276) TaxID=1071382 RepID=H2APS6_KAZAF|nr:hypothetical protein KAFR_0B00780 [Kazachstania africana CBS 2517]CCF56376.1 hypothetical protein KAFR_0B00780 [Kazachstania africana CBS 2517]